MSPASQMSRDALQGSQDPFEGLKTYWDALGKLLKSQEISWFVGPLARLSRGKVAR